MKEVFEKINGLQDQITELNRSAFNQLRTIIKDVCSIEDDGVKKIGKGCFIVKSSVLVGRPWGVEYVSNEVAGDVLIDKAAKIFAKRERIEDVLEYLNDIVSKAVDNSVKIEVGKGETVYASYVDRRVIKKNLVVRILALVKE
jgi:hypothetical protein